MKVFVRLGILLMVFSMALGCASKAKKAKETQEKLARWEKEEQAQRQKKQQQEVSAVPSSATGQRAEGIAARVNEEVIFFSEVEQAGREIYQRIREQTPAERVEKELREARRAVLERLINRSLLEQEAERLKVKITDEEMNSSLEEILKSHGVTREQFYAQLATEKVSPERFRERLRKELMVARMLDVLIRSHVHASDRECQEYYEKNYKAYQPGQPPPGDAVRIQQIILLVRDDSDKEKEQKRKLMEEIRSRVLKGEDFGKLARKYTQGPNPERGGDCGFFRPGELLPELDKVAFSLKPGEVSQVIETNVGFHLLKVMGREEATSRIPDTLKEEIRRKLEEKMYQEELQKFLESLRKSAFIEIRM